MVGRADDWHDEALEDDPGAREYRHLEQRFTTLGFVDGVEASQEEAMQSGFNDGFRAASAEAIEGGLLLGFISGLLDIFQAGAASEQPCMASVGPGTCDDPAASVNSCKHVAAPAGTVSKLLQLRHRLEGVTEGVRTAQQPQANAHLPTSGGCARDDCCITKSSGLEHGEPMHNGGFEHGEPTHSSDCTRDGCCNKALAPRLNGSADPGGFAQVAAETSDVPPISTASAVDELRIILVQLSIDADLIPTLQRSDCSCAPNESSHASAEHMTAAM